MSPLSRGRRKALGPAISVAALLLGLPGCAGLLLGMAPGDWPVPFGLQHFGGFGLRTVVYLSGFLLAFGAIGLVEAFMPRGDREEGETPLPAEPIASDTMDGPVSFLEPLNGFLPRAAQERIARETGYQPLLYTKISILLCGAIGVLLAGSFEFVSASVPIPGQAAARIAIGLYLMAESAHRYILFARRVPSGTLIGWIVSAVVSGLRSKSAS